MVEKPVSADACTKRLSRAISSSKERSSGWSGVVVCCSEELDCSVSSALLDKPGSGAVAELELCGTVVVSTIPGVSLLESGVSFWGWLLLSSPQAVRVQANVNSPPLRIFWMCFFLMSYSLRCPFDSGYGNVAAISVFFDDDGDSFEEVNPSAVSAAFGCLGMLSELGQFLVGAVGDQRAQEHIVADKDIHPVLGRHPGKNGLGDNLDACLFEVVECFGKVAVECPPGVHERFVADAVF